jgi:hypothetical protein
MEEIWQNLLRKAMAQERAVLPLTMMMSRYIYTQQASARAQHDSMTFTLSTERRYFFI